jgi:hypothetical protein
VTRRRVLTLTVGLAAVGSAIAAPLASAGPTNGFPPPCPVQPLVYQNSAGHIVVSVPDPTGQRCRDNIELPVGLPPL